MLNVESDIPLGNNFGIGVDIIEINRFRDLNAFSPFHKRIYTTEEMRYCSGFSDPAPHLAAIFAGKEAVLKAVGARTNLSMQSIEILHDIIGVPSVELCQLTEIKILLSLAHSKEYAVAIALLVPHGGTTSEAALQESLNQRISELLQGCE